MESFDYSMTTQVVAGDGVASRVGQFAAVFGERAVLVSGEISAHRNGAFGVVAESLAANGVEFEQLEGVPSNPSTGIVDAGSALARADEAQMIIAVGGGSVIDTAKAISIGAVAPHEFRSYLSGVAERAPQVENTLPVIAVPTLLGSGSETNGTSVIVDDISGRKLSNHSDLAAPRVALIDPGFTATAPPSLRAAGIADAMCHAIEAALSERATVVSDALAEQAVRTLYRHGVAAATESAAFPGDSASDDLIRCMWAANLAGQALSLAGSIVTHPLAHGLSARLGTHHGVAVAAIEPRVITAFGDRNCDGIIRVAGWLGARPTMPEPARDAVAKRLVAWFAKLGMKDQIKSVVWDDPIAREIVDHAMASGSRGLTSLPGTAPTVDDLVAVLA
jgi:alcohol dehydrogenase class IV